MSQAIELQYQSPPSIMGATLNLWLGAFMRGGLREWRFFLNRPLERKP
jgi:hypothetical protein